MNKYKATFLGHTYHIEATCLGNAFTHACAWANELDLAPWVALARDLGVDSYATLQVEAARGTQVMSWVKCIYRPESVTQHTDKPLFGE